MEQFHKTVLGRVFQPQLPKDATLHQTYTAPESVDFRFIHRSDQKGSFEQVDIVKGTVPSQLNIK